MDGLEWLLASFNQPVDDGIGDNLQSRARGIYSYFGTTRHRGSGACRIYAMFTLAQGC